MSEGAMLGVAGAAMLVMLGIIGFFVADKLASLASGMAALHGKFDKVLEEQAKLAKDCVPWEEFNKLRADVTYQGTEIAVIKTTCKAEHGK